MASSKVDTNIECPDSLLKVVISEKFQQVGILTSSIGCFCVVMEQHGMVIKGREVDVQELRRYLDIFLSKSELGRLVGTRIVDNLRIEGYF